VTLHKSPAQIRIMRRAGRVVAEMHEVCAALARPGTTTAQIDQAARDVLARRGARSNFLGYHGFPAVVCTSPNDVVVHGIPGAYTLEDGDILSLDCGAIIDGWHADAAITVGVGTITPEARRLIDTAVRSLDAAIATLETGRTLSDVGGAVETVATEAGYSIVREYVGHGIGTAMHEAPEIPNYRTVRGRRTKLQTGLVLAIEPMLTTGTAETAVLEDDWTVVTVDGGLAAHVEHTVALTDDGPEILTVA
jgi:methionyl aminopeptidase